MKCALCKRQIKHSIGSAFRVPAEEPRRRRWDISCKKTFKHFDRVCYRHFNAIDFMIPPGSGLPARLKVGAVPTLSENFDERYIEEDIFQVHFNLNINQIAMKRARTEPSEDPLLVPSTSKVLRTDKENGSDKDKLDLLLEKVSNIEKTLTSAVNLLHQLTEDYVLPSRETKEKPTFQDDTIDFILPPLPFGNVDSFLAFEDKIKNEYEFQALVKDFCKISGKHSGDFVSKCWRKIFVDGLAKSFSWQGTTEKGTVRMLATTAALSSAFKKKYPLDRYSIFEEKTKKFFQYAKDRETKVAKYRELAKEFVNVKNEKT